MAVIGKDSTIRHSLFDQNDSRGTKFYIVIKILTLMTTNNRNMQEFFNQFTATKDRPVSFQIAVTAIVASAVVLAIGSFVIITTSYQ